MDGNRFDDLTKGLAHGLTRRRLLGAASALAAGVFGARAAQAACPPGQIENRKGDCNCPAGTDACPNGCFNRKSDPSNCGACGNVCAVGAECVKGECRCPRGSRCATASAGRRHPLRTTSTTVAPAELLAYGKLLVRAKAPARARRACAASRRHRLASCAALCPGPATRSNCVPDHPSPARQTYFCRLGSFAVIETGPVTWPRSAPVFPHTAQRTRACRTASRAAVRRASSAWEGRASSAPPRPTAQPRHVGRRPASTARAEPPRLPTGHPAGLDESA